MCLSERERYDICIRNIINEENVITYFAKRRCKDAISRTSLRQKNKKTLISLTLEPCFKPTMATMLIEHMVRRETQKHQIRIAWNRVSWAERVVASVCRVWTFLSSSDIYRAFLSFDRAADCRFARILHHIMVKGKLGQKGCWWFRPRNTPYLIESMLVPTHSENPK